MKKFILSLFAIINVASVFAQSKSDITNGSAEITWLGIDFSQLKFIGPATQYQDAGEITSAALRDKYFPAWNNLVVNEPEKFKVNDAVNRTDVSYAIAITERSNNGLKGNFFSEDANDYSRLSEQNISSIVSNYKYQGKKGIGMMFVVEAMSKGKKEAAIWVTFMNMDTKKMILTHRVTAEAGGFGFRNFWAKTIMNTLKDTRKNLKRW